LTLDHEIIRRKSDVKSLLFHSYGLVLKNAALDGGLVSSRSLPHGDVSVGDFERNPDNPLQNTEVWIGRLDYRPATAAL
jgi:hypothetical protein